MLQHHGYTRTVDFLLSILADDVGGKSDWYNKHKEEQ
jgi:hypothetical protein